MIERKELPWELLNTTSFMRLSPRGLRPNVPGDDGNAFQLTWNAESIALYGDYVELEGPRVSDENLSGIGVDEMGDVAVTRRSRLAVSSNDSGP